MRIIIALLCMTFVGCNSSSTNPKAGNPGSSGAPDVPAVQDPVKRIWTCADKTRFLLRAEDNTEHCIKF